MDWLKAFMGGAANGREVDHVLHRPLGPSSPHTQGVASALSLLSAAQNATDGHAAPPAVTIIGTNAAAFAAWPALHDAGFRVVCVVPTPRDTYGASLRGKDSAGGDAKAWHALPGRDFVQLCLQTFDMPPALPSSTTTTASAVLQDGAHDAKPAEAEAKPPVEADERLRAVQISAAADYMSSPCFDNTDIILVTTADLPSTLLSAAPAALRGGASATGPVTSTGQGTNLEQFVTRCVAQGKHVVLGIPAAVLDLAALRRLADTLLGGGYMRPPSCMLLDVTAGPMDAPTEDEAGGNTQDALAALRQQLGLEARPSRTSLQRGGAGGYERHVVTQAASARSSSPRPTVEDNGSAAHAAVGRQAAGASAVGLLRALHFQLCLPRHGDAMSTPSTSAQHFAPDDAVWAEVPSREAAGPQKSGGPRSVLELLGWRVVRYVLELLQWAAPSSVIATALARDMTTGTVTRMCATLFFLHPQATRRLAGDVRAEDVLTVSLFLSMEQDVPLTQYGMAAGTEGTLDLPCPFFALTPGNVAGKSKAESPHASDAKATGVWRALRAALRAATAGFDMGSSSAGPFGTSAYLYPRHGAAMTGQRFRGGGAMVRSESAAAGRQRFTLKDRAALTEQLRRMWLLRAVLEKMAESMELRSAGVSIAADKATL